MEDKKILAGGGILVVILFLGVMIFGGGDDNKVEDMISGTLAPVSDSVAALDGRVGYIESAVDARIAEVSEALEAQVAGLQEKLDALAAQAEGAVSSEDLASIQSQIDGLAAAATQAPAPEAETPQASAEPAPAAGAAGTAPGQTAMLAGDALRVFVSRVSEEGARLSVNGDMFTLETGASRQVQNGESSCLLTLNSVSAGADLSATCGDDMPAAEGLAVGQTAVLADGALRVFVSKVGENDARLAVQGEMFELATSESREMQVGDAACTVTLDAVDRGLVQISGGC